MEAKTNIRRLLAGTSFVALLAASQAVLSDGAVAAGVTINTTVPSYTLSTTTDFIEITSSGKVQNTTGQSGVVVGSGGGVGGNITDDGWINVQGGASLAGIIVTSGASVGGDIINNGTGAQHGIKVLASQNAQSDAAVAGGILIDVPTVYGDIINNGSIKVDAHENSHVVVANFTSASALGHASAIASGMVAGDIMINGTGTTPSAILGNITNAEGALLRVHATAHSTHSATANGTSFSGLAHAVARDAYNNAYAYGVYGTAATIAGDIGNSGTLNVVANGTANNHAEAHALHGQFNIGNAVASATGAAGAFATGVGATGGTMHGDVYNDGTLNVGAHAETNNTATATATGNKNATANANGVADARAVGLYSDVYTLGGAISNDGDVQVIASATSHNDASVVDSVNSYDQAIANAHGSAHAVAYGMEAHFGYLYSGVGSAPIYNGGTINVSAFGNVHNVATVDVHGKASAIATGGSLGGAAATAIGIYAYGYVLGQTTGASYAFKNDGTINVTALAHLTNEAKATGTSFVNAVAHNSAAARAAGTGVSAWWVYGDYVNNGDMNVSAFGNIVNTADATVSGGDGQANAVGDAHAYGIGQQAYIGTLFGNFTNTSDASIDVFASAFAHNAAHATGTSLNAGYAHAYARGEAFAYAYGIDLSVGTSFGDIENNGAINVTAMAAVSNTALANAPAGAARATAFDSPTYASQAHALGIGVDASTVNGNFLNTGAVSVEASVRPVDSAVAHGHTQSEAYAVGYGIAGATGVSIGLGSITTGGNISNSGTITTTATVSEGSYAQANSDAGWASSQVSGRGRGYAAGLYIDNQASSVSNTGDITSSAVVGVWNGDALSSLLPSISMLGSLANISEVSPFPAIHIGDLVSQGGAFATGTSLAHAQAYGDAQAAAIGLDVEANTVAGQILNSGEINALALALSTNAAHALAHGYGAAQATADGGAHATATGISIGSNTIGGFSNLESVSHSGSMITVAAIAGSVNVADASGTALGTSLATIDASARVHGSAYAYGYGLLVGSDTIYGSVENTGDIFAIGGAFAVNIANAHTPYGNAYAAATDQNFTYGVARGLEISTNTISGSVTNSGDILSIGAAISVNMATASGTSLGHANQSTAFAIGGAQAHSSGLGVYGNTINGSIGNSGNVDAIAIGYVRNQAQADGRDAHASGYYYGVYANATALDVSFNTIGGGFNNSGDITAFSLARQSSIAHATGASHASGTGVSNAFAAAYGDIYGASMEASAHGIEFYADRIGLTPSTSGSFVNSGDVNVGAFAGGNAFLGGLLGDGGNQAIASGSHSAHAYATGPSIAAIGTGIRVNGYTFSGDVSNSGHITVGVGASSLNHAEANGGGYGLAYAAGSAQAEGYGIMIGDNQSPSIGGSFTNSGQIDVSVLGYVHNAATATGAYAQAYAGLVGNYHNYYYGYDRYYFGADARGTGISASFNTIAGNLDNSGAITVHAFATSVGDAKATGSSYAVAYAVGAASASALGANLYANSVGGDVQNSGAITLTAVAKTTVNATAINSTPEISTDTLAGGYASAYADGIYAGANATGLRFNGYTVDGSIINTSSGDMTIYATAGDQVVAKATGHTYAGAAAIAYNVYATAIGIDVGSNYNPSVGGDFVNQGDLSIHANGGFDATAQAKVDQSGYAYAYAYGGYANSYAAGIIGRFATLDGNFSNAGTITVDATVHVTTSAKATGVSTGGAAWAQGRANAHAIGISFYASSMGGNFVNDGAVTVGAHATADNRAEASGNYAYAYGSGYGDSDSHANATGISVTFSDYFDGSVMNDAAVHAVASAKNYDHATATKTGVSGAYSTAYAHSSAQALGMEVRSYSGSLGGNVENTSIIDAVAKSLASAVAVGSAAHALARAQSTSTGLSIGLGDMRGMISNGAMLEGDAPTPSIHAHATATAKASGTSESADASAYAIGISAYINGSLGGGFQNTGNIEADAIAHATAGDFAYAQASATGVSLHVGTSTGGDILNSGLIRGAASANATGTGVSSGHGNAYAKGLWLEANGGITGAVLNSGTIEATAIVHATPVGGGVGDAYATALYIHSAGMIGVTGISTGLSASLGNSGTIKAIASDPLHSQANAIILEGGWYTGTLENTNKIEAFAHATGSSLNPFAAATAIDMRSGASFAGALVNDGTILAQADAVGGTANATAIKVRDGGYFGDGIINRGVIEARATGESISTVAIDLTYAGQGHLIQQLGAVVPTETDTVTPGIYGDITMVNTHTDTIDWSGGKIGGMAGSKLIHSNIYGDANDTLNVFAGEDNNFTYDDNIQGLYEINVNTSAHASTGVSLTISGNIGTDTLNYNKIQNFNVNNSATLVLQPTAQVNVTNFNVAGTGMGDAAAATVQWNIKPTYPQYATITADHASIGTGANSVAYGMPGLFAKNNDFWVIHSTDLTGTFSATDYGTVTPLGTFLNGLYTIEDRYIDSSTSASDPLYGKDGYHIVVTRISFGAMPGITEDGINIGNAIDNILDWLNQNDPEGPLAGLLSQILTGTPEGYAHAMTELAGAANIDMLQAGLQDPQQLLDTIFNQLAGGAGGGTGGVADLGALLKVAANTPGDVMSDAGPQYASLAKPSVMVNPVTIWARAFGNWSKLDGDSGVGAPGFSGRGGGVVVGGDYAFTDNFKAGLAGSYQKDKLDFDGGHGNADIKTWSASAYGRYEQGPLSVDGIVSYGSQTYSLNRNYQPIVPGPVYSAHRSPDGTSVSAGLRVGYSYDLDDKSKLEPFVGFIYSHTKVDGSTETGSGPLNLTVADESANSASSRLGVKWSKTFGTDGGTSWTPELSVGWKHEFGDEQPTTTASLAGVPGSSFTVNSSSAGRDFAMVGAGVTVQLTDQLDGTIQYDGDFSNKYTDSTASLRLRLKF